MPTNIVAPVAPAQALTNAEQTLITLLTERDALITQLTADLTSVAAGWQTLDVATQTAILTRMLDAFGTIMEALVATVTAAQVTTK